MSYCCENMSALPGNYSESSERSSEGTQCRLCMKKNDYYYNIFTSNVACRVTVKDTMHGLLGLEVAVGDGLPTVLCPVCLKKLTEFSVFKKICLESDEKLRKFSGSDYFRSIQGDEATDDKLGSSTETTDCIQDVMQGTSHLTGSVLRTEIYIPVPDFHQSGANMLAQASTSFQGEEVDAKATAAIVIDSMMVLANKELSPKETDATETLWL